MTATIILLAALTGCGSAGADSLPVTTDASAAPAATAPRDSWPDAVPDSLARTPLDRTHEGVEPAAATLRLVRADLEALDPTRRARVADAALETITNCPYNRSSVQVAMVMQQVLAAHDDPALAALKAGIDDQVAILDLLGATALPLPRQGDYLHRDMPGLVTGAQLLDAPDPVAVVHQLLAQVPDLVRDYDSTTTNRLEAANDVLAPATHRQWPLKDSLVGFRVEVERLAAGTSDDALRRDLEALDAMLTEYVGLMC